MNKKAAAILIVGLLALGLRWYASISLPTDYDETVYYAAAHDYAQMMRQGHLDQISQYENNYEHPVLSKLGYGLVFSWLPPDRAVLRPGQFLFASRIPVAETFAPFHVLALRQVSVGFGTLEVVLLALVSPLAALLLAVHSMTVKYTSVIYLEALPAFFSLASILLFQRALPWFRTDEKLSIRRHWAVLLWMALSAAALGAAVAGKYLYATAGIAAALYGAVLTVRSRSGSPSRTAVLLGWGLFALGIFVLADPYLWPDPWGRLAHSMQYSLDYAHNEVVRSAGYPFYQPLLWLAKSVLSHPRLAIPAGGSEFPVQLDGLIAVLALLGLPRLKQRSPLVFSWLVVGIVFLLLWGTKWPQYVLVVTVPVCISAAEGIKTIFYTLRQILQRSLVLHPQQHHVQRGVDHF